MTLLTLTHQLLKIISAQQGDLEVCSSIAELELPIDSVRVVDLLPQPGGQVVQFVTRFDGPSVEFSTEPGTKTTVEHSPALVEVVTARLRAGELLDALNRIVTAWDLLQPCVLTSKSNHPLAYLTNALNDARGIIEQHNAAGPK